MHWKNSVNQKNQENQSNFNKVAYLTLCVLPAAKTDVQLHLPVVNHSTSAVQDGRVQLLDLFTDWVVRRVVQNDPQLAAGSCE